MQGTNEIRELTAVEMDEVAGSSILDPIGQAILRFHRQEEMRIISERAEAVIIYNNVEME